MPLGALQHYTIEPADLERTKDFYCAVLGLENGDRPPLGFPGYWLYSGGVATVHANTAESALRRLEQLTAEASRQPMHEVIGEAVDLVVSIERTPTGRRVREILEVEGFVDGHYLTRPLTAEARRHVA